MPTSPFSKAVLQKLEQMRMDEVSGVDAGANLIDGWMVMKNRQRVEKALTDLIDKTDVRADRHAVRHPSTGRYVPKPKPEDEIDGAAAASANGAMKTVLPWRHGGLPLLCFRR